MSHKSDKENGHEKGYKDDHRQDTGVVDFFLGVSDREKEWRKGYENGYKEAKKNKKD